METNSGGKGKLFGGGRDTEQQLKEYQAKFKTLFDNVSSGVAIYEARNDGKDFVFVDFNRAAEEIDHIRIEELIGKNVAEVFPGVQQFGLLDVFRRVYKTGTPEHHPVSVYKDERIAGWRENCVYKLPSGQIVAVYDDISAQTHRVSDPDDRPVLPRHRELHLRLGGLGRACQPDFVDEPGGGACHRLHHKRAYVYVGLSGAGRLQGRP